MNILIVNDDGINASGIIRLAAAAKKYGKVWVVAPESQRSGASHSINLHEPIGAWEVDFPVEDVTAWAITGSPADCARVGILSLMPVKPDLVLSGINYGYNAGTDVMYSGTVGAAMEAVFQGIPAIALSEATNEGTLVTDKYLEQVLDELIPAKFIPDEIINVNFPYAKPEEVKGILRDRKASRGRLFDDRYDLVGEKDGKKQFMVNGVYQEVAEEGTDLKAIFDKYISIGTIRNIM